MNKKITMPELRFAQYVAPPEALAGRIEPVQMIVDDPNPTDDKKLVVFKNVRKSVFDYWYKNYKIDGAQHAAALELTRLFHVLRADGNIALDLSQPFADKSIYPDNFDKWPRVRQEAFDKMGKALQKVGHAQIHRLQDLCEGSHLKEAAAKYGFFTAEDIKFYSRLLKDALFQLVGHWKMQTG